MPLPVLQGPPGMFPLPRYAADPSAAIDGELLPADYPLPPRFPGSAPPLSSIPPRSVLLGDYAECALNGAVCVFLFEWKVKLKTEFADTTGHGDIYKTFLPIEVEWSATARGYVEVTSIGTYISQYYGSAGPLLLTFTAYKGAKSGGQPIFQGKCYVEEGELSVPMNLAEQSILLRGTGAPTVGIAGSVGSAHPGAPPMAAISAGSAQGNSLTAAGPAAGTDVVSQVISGIVQVGKNIL